MHPSPHVPALIDVFTQRPAATDGKGFKCFLVLNLFYVAKQQGLTLIHDVQIAVLPRGINVVPDVLEHAGIQACVIRHKEADIGRIHTHLTHCLIFLEDRHIRGGQRIAVGDVQIDEIHADIAEHRGMLADDPLVVGQIVAKIGLPPVVSPTDGALTIGFLDGGMTALLINCVMIVQDLVGIGRARLYVPDLIEHAHQLIIHVICPIGYQTVFIVHTHPRVAVKILQRFGVGGGVFRFHLFVPTDFNIVKGTLTHVSCRCPEADKAISVQIMPQGMGDLLVSLVVIHLDVMLVLNDKSANKLTFSAFLDIHGNDVIDGIVLNQYVAHRSKRKLRNVHLCSGPARDQTDLIIVECKPDAIGTGGTELIPLRNAQAYVRGYVVHRSLSVCQHIQLHVNLICAHATRHIQVAMLIRAYYHAILKDRRRVVAPMLVARNGGIKILRIAACLGHRGITGYRPVDLQVIKHHTAVILMRPQSHEAACRNIVAKLGGDLGGTVFVGYGHIFVISDLHLENQFLGIIFLYVDQDHVILLVVLYDDLLCLGKVYTAIKEGNTRPGVDNADLAALKSQPDAVLSHGGKLIVILGKAQGNVSRVVGNRSRSVCLQIHAERHQIRLCPFLERKVGVLTVVGCQVAARNIRHFVEIPIGIVSSDRCGEILHIFVMLVRLFFDGLIVYDLIENAVLKGIGNGITLGQLRLRLGRVFRAFLLGRGLIFTRGKRAKQQQHCQKQAAYSFVAFHKNLLSKDL